MNQKAQLQLDGRAYELPTTTGSEGEKAVEISTLRDLTGYITLDDGYGNTGSCRSAVTFIDGEKGILRYRGIPIEELAVKSTFVETAHLLIYGKLPTRPQLARFSDLLTEHANLHEGMKHHFEGFPSCSHPMAMLSRCRRRVCSLKSGPLRHFPTGNCAGCLIYIRSPPINTRRTSST
jgi:citrate synthase